MKTTFTRVGLAATAAAAVFATTNAHATNGYFSHGYGTAAKGMAGAGVAAPQDTQAAVNNPAGMRNLGNRFDASVAYFTPERRYDASTAEVFIADTNEKSQNVNFFIPSIGASWDMGTYSLGLTMSANGGMNTDYQTNVFSGGTRDRTGIDLMQGFVGLTYARELDDRNTIGITPTIALQTFEATGLQGFAAISTDGNNLTDNAHDYSWGGGLRVGWLHTVNDQWTVGLSGQTRMYMTKFHKYKGLFAENGDFDIPPSASLGASYKHSDKLTINGDYQRIFYNQVASISNDLPSVQPFHTGAGGSVTSKSLGGDDGVGFGWQDMNVFKLGGEYVYSPEVTLRAGISYNTDAFQETETLFNILAPAVVDTHLSGGATFMLTDALSFNFALTHAFASDITGSNVNHATIAGLGGSGNAHDIKLEMYQTDLEVGLSYNF